MTASDPIAAWAELLLDVPVWFRDAKLGIFIHWGGYSVPAWAEPTGARPGDVRPGPGPGAGSPGPVRNARRALHAPAAGSHSARPPTKDPLTL
jgi:hypothetical protein